MSNAGQGEASHIVAAATKFYYFPSIGSGRGGGQRVALRGPEGNVSWLHGDHLGSTSLATAPPFKACPTTRGAFHLGGELSECSHAEPVEA